MPINDVRISPLDRGFLFADGVYEVVPVYNKNPFFFREHLARLYRSLNKIRLDYLENIYHAGTKSENNEIYAVGGRVLNFVSLSDNFADARKSVINKISELNWPGGFYRKDIGFKVINE